MSKEDYNALNPIKQAALTEAAQKLYDDTVAHKPTKMSMEDYERIRKHPLFFMKTMKYLWAEMEPFVDELTNEYKKNHQPKNITAKDPTIKNMGHGRVA